MVAFVGLAALFVILLGNLVIRVRLCKVPNPFLQRLPKTATRSFAIAQVRVPQISWICNRACDR